MLTYKLYFIRHGMTEGNRDGKYVGWTDLELCDEGKSQLLQLKSDYDYPEVQEVYSSPLLRCIQTADLLYPEQDITVIEGLKELSMGDFEGKSMDALAKMPAYQQWLANSLQNTPPGSQESTADFAQRISDSVNMIIGDMSQRGISSAAVVTHGGVIMGLMTAHAFPKLDPASWAVANGGGFAAVVNAQMWMRDAAFEVLGHVPFGFAPGNDPKVIKSLGVK